MKYINKLNKIHGIGLLTTCGYQYCGVKTYFNVIAMFDHSYFVLPVLQNTLHHFFAWIFYHFTFLPIFGGDIIRIKTDACGKSGE